VSLETAALTLTGISQLDELERLEPEWIELWKRCPGATPFQSPAWLMAWWRHFGGNGLWTMVFRNSDRLIGVAPFFIFRPDSGIRQLTLIGTGISDCLDVLADPELESFVRSEIISHLHEQRERWDVCDFQELRGDALLLRVAAPIEWEDDIVGQSICPVLSLPDRVENLPGTIPQRTWKDFRYYGRRAEKLGKVSFEIAREENFGELFDALIRLHSACWTARGKRGGLDEPAIQNFQREAARNLLSLGALRLHALRINGRIVACLYAFASGKRTYFYLSGFDPEFSRLSPGTLMIGHAIEQAVREGMDEFDFLRGQENYKYTLGAKDRVNYRRRLLRGTSSLAQFAENEGS
jgi:CelD/BcsL family acetyltransferase involved in cellulose biosynthesis